MPTPRSSRETTSNVRTVNKIPDNSTVSKKLIQNESLKVGPTTDKTFIKQSSSNSSIQANEVVRKPPIPNPNNAGIKKSTSLIRHDKESTQLQLQQSITKADNRGQTPRISSNFTTNRSTSTTSKVLMNTPSTTSTQNRKIESKSQFRTSLAPESSDMSRTRLISPSGLLVDGPLNRKSSISPGRNDHSTSPSKYSKNISANVQANNKLQTKLNDINKSSSSIASSPNTARKNGAIRRSLLPQPMSVLRRPSTSPSGYEI